MKAIIPAAGQGTRLYPQTHTKPKAMIRLAGRPILGHILGNLAETHVDEVVIVVGGQMQEQIVDYAMTAFSDTYELTFPEQETAEGLGHSIYQAEEVVRGESAIIALGDMLFENGYENFLNVHRGLNDTDGSIGVKRVDNPRHYGIIESDEQNRIRGLVEKPDNPPSDHAVSGVYIIDNTDALFDALEYIISNNHRGAGDEYQLTDALQRMIETNQTLKTFEVDDWYDCGRPETLLEANRVLLSKLETNKPERIDSSVIIPPVDMGKNVTVEKSVVGPNVSLDDGATVANSLVQESIVGHSATLESVNLKESIIGDKAKVRGEANHLNVGDYSSINL